MHPLSFRLPNGLPAHIKLTVKVCDQRQKIFSGRLRRTTELTEQCEVIFRGLDADFVDLK